MNGRKANWAFLITILCYIGLAYVLALYFPMLGESLVWGNLFCELVVLTPVFLFTVFSKEKPGSFLIFRRIKLSSVLMVALFTFLTMPTLTLINLISQLWVENEVAAMMEGQSQVPFGLLYLSVGVIAPLLEEVACRGFFYHSYRRSTSAFSAMLLSALLFALVHMNFNQAGYAFVVGILSVLLMEATGSLWSSILYHGLINGSQALLMIGVLRENPQAYSEQAALITSDFLLYGISVYLVLAAVTLPLSWAVLVWLEGNGAGRGALAKIWRARKQRPWQGQESPSRAGAGDFPTEHTKRDKVFTLPLVLALILCAGVMTGLMSRLILAAAAYAGISFP